MHKLLIGMTCSARETGSVLRDTVVRVGLTCASVEGFTAMSG